MAAQLYAAGSLRGALTEVGQAFQRETGIAVEGTFGASGLLRERIEKGEGAEVFASANMEHPRTLEKAGKGGPVRLFARNQLCALAKPGVTVTTATLLDRMLDPGIKLGTSTPRADPSGDYAWEVFRKADLVDVSLGLVKFGIAGSDVRAVKQQFPNIDFPTVSVRLSYPGGSPSEIRDAIVKPMEDAIAGAPDLDFLTSSIQQGQASITARSAASITRNSASLSFSTKASSRSR